MKKMIIVPIIISATGAISRNVHHNMNVSGLDNEQYVILQKGAILKTCGVRQGDEVSVFYDPMIAKLVVWGPIRLEALNKLRSKLIEYHIAGLDTNVNFLLDLAKHEEFEKGNVHTNFIKENFDSLFPAENIQENDKIQAALAVILNEKENQMQEAKENADIFNPFILESNFRINNFKERDVIVTFRDEEIPVKVKFIDGNNFEVSLNEGKTWSRVHGVLKSNNENTNMLETTIEDFKSKCSVFGYDDKIALFNENGKTEFTLPHLKPITTDEEDSSLASDKAASPMPGIIDKIFVKQGDVVKKGDNLFVLIAMKMEHMVKASRDAEIQGVYFKPGDNVAKDAVIVAFIENV